MNIATEFHPVPKPVKKRRKFKTTYTKELRDYIKERDGWCRVCGRPGDEVHHVIPRGRFKVHPEWYTFTDVHDERNLMYICSSCHHKATDNNNELEAVIWIQEKRFGPLRKLVDWQ